jgi:high-affinity nickel-transport protein
MHVHLGADTAHAHGAILRMGLRPFLVGLLHGLAGSAALSLLVATTTSSPLGALIYVLVFGAGSTAGMLVLSGMIGLPFALTGRYSATLHTVLRLVAGLAGLGLGVALI